MCVYVCACVRACVCVYVYVCAHVQLNSIHVLVILLTSYWLIVLWCLRVFVTRNSGDMVTFVCVCVYGCDRVVRSAGTGKKMFVFITLVLFSLV